MSRQARRVTASDVARSLGISRTTVGYVLNNTPGQTISEATRAKVFAEAERLGYRPHAAAQALARGSSRVVLFLLPDWPVGHTFAGYLDGAESVLAAAGYTMVTGTNRNGGRPRPLLETLGPDMVVPIAPLADDEIAAFRPDGAPQLFRDAELDPEQLPAMRIGSTLQVEHLHELGHTRLAFAAPGDARVARLAAARASAVRERATELGLEVIDERTIPNRDDAVTTVIEDWVTKAVTGVVAYDDDVAAAVVRAAIRADVAVPRQLAVVGHDDSPLARLFLPGLTSVRVDAVGMGRHIAHAVLHSLGADGEPPPALPDLNATVVRRETT
ncbi:LacI family DNA-binding transcriptional regulator [Spirillospora sp. CA-255316]